MTAVPSTGLPLLGAAAGPGHAAGASVLQFLLSTRPLGDARPAAVLAAVSRAVGQLGERWRRWIQNEVACRFVIQGRGGRRFVDSRRERELVFVAWPRPHAVWRSLVPGRTPPVLQLTRYAAVAGARARPY